MACLSVGAAGAVDSDAFNSRSRALPYPASLPRPHTSPRPYAPRPPLSTLQFTTWPVVTFWRSFMVFRGWDVVQVSLFTQVLAHVDLVLAQFGEGVAAHVHGRTGGVLDVSVVHADELAVAGGAYGKFRRRGRRGVPDSA